MEEIAIKVERVSKVYRLYEKPSDRLRDALGIGRKKRYKEHFALKNVSFQVKRGESVGIIGTNGSGKSTILKIITGVLNPTDGDVTVNGRISALLELGAGFNMEYTGMENIYLNGTMSGFTKEEVDARLDEILDFADIGDFVYQPCKTYSSGMFVRLAFAVAINIDPEILIVDEALSVGDVFFQAKCYKKFEEFQKMGKTILFVSHDLSSISKYCSRVVLLNQGDLVAEGGPREMVNLYKRFLANQAKAAGTADAPAAADAADKFPRASLWKSNYTINPGVDEYGTGAAHIIDFAVVDESGKCTNTIVKGTSFQIRSKVRFFEPVANPIFTFTFKNIKGTAVTGTNTMIEKADIGTAQPGEVYVATFEQDMSLQGGEYLLSISCTGYAGGEFRVYHRLYDVIGVTVISDKDTVGFYDMNSKTSIEKVEGE